MLFIVFFQYLPYLVCETVKNSLDNTHFLWYYLSTNYGFIVIMKALVYPAETFSEVAISVKNIEIVALSQKESWACLLKMKSGKILAVRREEELVKKLNPKQHAVIRDGEIVII
jgi:hypothetical protein